MRARRTAVSSSGGEHADDVSVVQRHAVGHLLQLAAPPEERPVDAAPVDDEPVSALVLERAVGLARDEQLRIGLERDVVDLRQAADRHPLAGELACAELSVRAGDDDAGAGARFH